ncbi:MAG: tetratricopeptide repeat protein [Flavobacteriales bacterium]|nr:tetratricopeptide repeat protein [Flavobacteriales bacterium]MCB9365289.1 tetratricopeptide repeat protein [Flavobacteriales bacterium]
MSKLEEARQLFNSNKFNEAIELFTNFLAEQPNHADALFFRAICYRKIEKYELSVADFTAIIKRLSDEATIFSERAVSYYHLKNYKAAVDDLNKAVELEPNNPYRYSSRAYIRAYIDIDGAMADYERAIELDPQDDISYNNLGLLQENQGSMRKAQENFERNKQILANTPKTTEPLPQVKKQEIEEENLTFWNVIKQLMTSKKTQKEFGSFLKNGFKKKQD